MKNLQVALSLIIPIVLASGMWVSMTAKDEARSASSQALDRRLEAHPPRIVLLGNSLVRHAVDVEQLAELLELEVDDIAKIALPGTRMPTAYAILKNRVFGGSFEPDVVLIMHDLDRLLQTDPPQSGHARLRFEDQLGASEPELSAKMTQGSPRVQRFKNRRERIRTAILNGWRDTALRVTLGETDGEAIEASLGRLFEAENLIRQESGQVGPIVEVRKVEKQVRRSPDASLIPDLANMVRGKPSKLVLVRMPTKVLSNVSSPEAVSEIIELLPDNAAFLDLSSGFADGLFVDTQHLNSAGREQFTEILATSLKEMQVIGPGELIQPGRSIIENWTITPSATPIRRISKIDTTAKSCLFKLSINRHFEGWFRSRRVFTDPPIELVGRGIRAAYSEDDSCDGGFSVQGTHLLAPQGEFESLVRSEESPLRGDATLAKDGLWVLPGESLELVLELSVEAELELSLTRFSSGDTSIEIGDENLVSSKRYSSIRRSLDSGRSIVTISTEPRGPAVFIGFLRVGRQRLMGSDRNRKAGIALVGQRRDRVPITMTEPPRLPGPVAVKQAADKPLRITLEEGMSIFGSQHLDRLIGRRDCNPLRIRLNGSPLDLHYRRNPMGASSELGFARHGGRELIVNAPELTSASREDLSLHLDPSRFCDKGNLFWVYPGDRVTFDFSSIARKYISDGIGEVELTWIPIDGAGELVVSWGTGEEHRLSSPAQTLSVDLLPSLEADSAHPNGLTVSNPSDSPVLIQNLFVANDSRLD